MKLKTSNSYPHLDLHFCFKKGLWYYNGVVVKTNKPTRMNGGSESYFRFFASNLFMADIDGFHTKHTRRREPRKAAIRTRPSFLMLQEKRVFLVNLSMF